MRPALKVHSTFRIEKAAVHCEDTEFRDLIRDELDDFNSELAYGKSHRSLIREATNSLVVHIGKTGSSNWHVLQLSCDIYTGRLCCYLIHHEGELHKVVKVSYGIGAVWTVTQAVITTNADQFGEGFVEEIDRQFKAFQPHS